MKTNYRDLFNLTDYEVYVVGGSGLIGSQIINTDDIVKNYDLHISNIKKIDSSIKDILNYNLRSYLGA